VSSDSTPYDTPSSNVGDNRNFVSVDSNYVFKNPRTHTPYSGTVQIGLGTWILEDVPETHPIGIVQSGTNIEYHGDISWYTGTASKTGASAISGVNYYSGRVTLYVKGDFGSASFHCANHGKFGKLYHDAFCWKMNAFFMVLVESRFCETRDSR